MTTALAETMETVRERVTPTPEEREELERTVSALTERAREAIADLPVPADPLLVGSAARDTWISGDRDIDLFVRFPPDIPREDLTRYGLAVGHHVLPDGREEYAEHPYVTAEFHGFDVDLVPCYAVESASEIQSSVDRTPFHTMYLEDRLTEALTGEIRVFKAFLKGIGVYGSDLKTRGFSGYLTELLVLEYGDAARAIRAAADWEPPVTFDPAAHGHREFDDPLVMVDPTDPDRNVAAVVSPSNVARLQHYARRLLADPTTDRFHRPAPAAVTPDAVREHVRRRGTTPVAIAFEAPDLVEDELYPQLRKSLGGIAAALSDRGFDVLRQTMAADDRAVLLFDLDVAERPAIERHVGPPVHVRDHAERFYETYADADVYGPYIEEDRYVVERDREFESARAFVGSDALFDARLGPAVEAALEDGYDVLVGEAVATLAEEFGETLGEYYEPRP